jgi:hypothetical protein
MRTVLLLLLLHAAAADSPPPPGAAVNWAAAALGATATANSAGYWVRAWRACVRVFFPLSSLMRGVH